MNSSCLIVFFVCCPSSNKRKSIAVFPNPKYYCMGDITGCLLGALAAHSCSWFFGGSYQGEQMEHQKREQMAIRQKAAKSYNCQILIFVWKCRQQLVIPFEVIHLAIRCTSTALMIDLFCLSFLWIKGTGSAEKEQRLKMGRFDSYRWHWGEELLGAGCWLCQETQNMRSKIFQTLKESSNMTFFSHYLKYHVFLWSFWKGEQNSEKNLKRQRSYFVTTLWYTVDPYFRDYYKLGSKVFQLEDWFMISETKNIYINWWVSFPNQKCLTCL